MSELYRPGEPIALQFTGRADEYFRIWLVNLCLSVITLGLYSPWAKVRRKRYFYGSTLLAGSAFDYHGQPVAILKGRLIVVGAFAVYSLSQEFVPLLSAALAIALLVVMPWVLQRALQFNARNSSYRNIRFGFHGTKMDVFGVLLGAVLLVPATLGFGYPLYMWLKRRLLVEGSSYGGSRFAFGAKPGMYYGAAFKVSLAFVGFLIGSIITIGIGLLPLYFLLRAYAEATFARLEWRNTTLADIRFDCQWTTGGLFALYFVNSLGVIFTLGLATPWAAIRTARYKLERLTLISERGLEHFLSAAGQDVTAVGDEAGEMLGFDFGL